MTKEEAVKRIAELKSEAETKIREAQLIATEHGISFHWYDDDYRSTFYPTIEAFSEGEGWDLEEAENIINKSYYLSIPGWVSSSAFC